MYSHSLAIHTVSVSFVALNPHFMFAYIFFKKVTWQEHFNKKPFPLVLCSICVHVKGLWSEKGLTRGKKTKTILLLQHCHSQNNVKKDFPPCFSQRVITCKCHDHLSPARRRVQITQAWFCASQQGVSGKRNQGRYAQREEWHYCLRLVAECRILLTFGIWRRIKLAAAQGLAPAFDTPGQGGAWTTLRLMHLSSNTDTRGLKFQFCDIFLKLMNIIGGSSVTLSFCCGSWRKKCSGAIVGTFAHVLDVQELCLSVSV